MADRSTDVVPAGERGSLTIRHAALERLIRHAVLGVPGTISAPSGVRALIGASLPRITVTTAGDHVRVRIDAATAWPAPLSRTAAQVRERVAAVLRDQGGMTVDRVDVTLHPTNDTADQATRRVQ